MAEPRTGKSMGEHCELMAKEWNIPREEQDQLALASHQKAAAAYERGFFNGPRGAVSAASSATTSCARTPRSKNSATLKPAFDKTSGQGTLTAGNSTPLTDGASAVLLASEEWAAHSGIEAAGVPHRRAGRGGGFRRTAKAC